MSTATDLLTIDEALALVLERVRPLEAEDVPLEDAAGRVLAEDARSAVDLPPFPASAMDGFALRAADAPGTLPIVARIAAGRPAPRALEAGEAMAIATGGVVPDGADSVVPIEDVEEGDDAVTVPGVGWQGDNVAAARRRPPGRRHGRRRGHAARAGARRRAGGRRRSRPCAATAYRASSWSSPGTELAAPGEPLGPGEIYDANGFILATQVRSAGAEVERLPPVKDDAEATRAAIERGLAADVLVTTGGVSVGVYDLVRAAEAELGVEEVFWRVAVRPGQAGRVRRPRAARSCSACPATRSRRSSASSCSSVRRCSRCRASRRRRRRSGPDGSAGPARRLGARDSLLRARSRVEDGDVVLEPLTGQESHMIAQAATADALVLVPRGEGELEAGSVVSYLAL